MKQSDENIPVIVIDTREQNPLTFTMPTERATLRVGDYSCKGYEDRIAIERKEINDCVHTLQGVNRSRFERELVRSQSLEYFALVIEADLDHLVKHEYRSQMTPKSVIQSLVVFSIRHRLPIFFAGNRRYAGRLVESLLSKFIRELEAKDKDK